MGTKVYDQNPMENINIAGGEKNRESTQKTLTSRIVETARFGPFAAAFGALESVGETLGVLDDGELSKYLADEVANPQLPMPPFLRSAAREYTESDSGYKLIGETAVAFSAIGLATKFVQSGGYLSKGFSKLGETGKFMESKLLSTGMTRAQRMKNLKAEEALFIRQKNLGLVNTEYQTAVSKQKWGMATDLFKESVAGELALYAALKDSDVFFPEEQTFSDYLMWSAVPAVAVSAIGGAAMRSYANSYITRNVSPKVAEALNNKSLALTELTTMVEFRGVGLSASSSFLADQKASFSVARDAQEKANLNALIVQETGHVDSYVVDMANDVVYGRGIDDSFLWNSSSDKAYINTVTSYTQGEPTAAIGMTSLIPATADSVKSVPMKKTSAIEALSKQRLEVKNSIDDLELNSPEYKKAVAELADLKIEETKIREMTSRIIEVDGSVIALADKRWNLLDDIADKNLVQTVTQGGFTKLGDKHAIALGANIAMLEEGKFYFDASAAGAKQQRNYTTVLQPHQIADEQKNVASRAFEDMTYMYDLDLGVYGKQVKESLPSVFVAAMIAWKRSSHASPFRDWLATQPTRLDEIRKAFDDQGFRERLLEFADDDGFLTLYRGEDVTHLKDSPFSLVSMTPRPSTAETFGSLPGNQVIKKIVHVDDVVMPNNMASYDNNHEFELLVKENQARVFEQQMNYEQRIGGWAVTQRQLDAYKPKDAKTIRLSRGRESFEYDYAVKVLEKYPDADVRYIGEAGEVTGEAAKREMQFESFRQKAFSFQEWYAARMLNESDKLPQAIKLRADAKLPESEILRAHNLPMPDSFGDAPIVQLLKELTPLGDSAPVDIRVIYKDLAAVEEAARKRVLPNYLDEAGLEVKALRMDGSALKQEIPKDRKPVIAHYNNVMEDRVTAGTLNNLIADQKAVAMSALENADRTGGTIVKAVYDGWNGDPTARYVVGQMGNLTEGVQRTSKITTHNFQGRSAPQLQLADQLGEVAKKAGDKIVSDLWKGKSEVFTKIMSSKHSESSNFVTIAAHELSQGWDVLAEPVVLGGGKFGLALDPKSARNETLAQNLFGAKLKSMADESGLIRLPTRAKQESLVVLDELSLEGLQGLTELSQTYLDNVNAIRKAYGMEAINKREWHLPYFNMENKEVLYMMDESGRVAYPIPGNTVQQVQELAEEEIKTAAKMGKPMYYQSEDALRTHIENIGAPFEQMTDMSKAGLQTSGKSLRGSPLTAEIGKGAFKGIITRLQSNFDDVVRYSSAAAMRSELDQAARLRNSLNVGADKVVQRRETVFDHFTRSVLQTPSLSDRTAMGALNKAIEKVADRGLSLIYDKYRGIVPVAAHATEAEFKAVETLYGKQNSPYSDIADMLMKTQKTSAPPTSRKFVAAMNKFAGDYVLRVLDMGMPVINAASLVAVQPAVLKAMQRAEGEDLLEWKQRIGAWASKVDDDFALPSTGRMTATGMHHMFSKEGREALALYKEMGLLRHDVYERIETITAPIKGYTARMYDKGIKTLSFATDKSEELARAGSFMMNHAVASKLLGLKGKAAINFAHKHTNAVVGDYRAMNKPQIFQGVAGMPFGLFSTWVWNFGQRVFGDLEGGRLGAVGMQLVMQQVMFGAESHPMSKLLLETVTTNYDGTENFVDRLERAIGTDATNVFMNGTIAQITGVGIQGRSSVTAPALFRGEFTKELVPALGVADTIASGVVATWKASSTVDGLSMDKMLEILGTYKVNGALSNTANHINGYSVDRAGNMVNGEINNMIDIISHSLELKSLRELERMREMSKDKRVDIVKREHIANVRKSFKTLIRNIETTDAKEFSSRIDDILGAYYLADGDPDALRGMMTRWTAEAVTDKSLRLLVRRLKDNAQDGGTARLYLDYAK